MLYRPRRIGVVSIVLLKVVCLSLSGSDTVTRRSRGEKSRGSMYGKRELYSQLVFRLSNNGACLVASGQTARYDAQCSEPAWSLQRRRGKSFGWDLIDHQGRCLQRHFVYGQRGSGTRLALVPCALPGVARQRWTMAPTTPDSWILLYHPPLPIRHTDVDEAGVRVPIERDG